jgi:hypothetical protein
MNPSRTHPFNFTETFLGILLIAGGLQMGNAYAWSLCGGLEYSWSGSMILLGLTGTCLAKQWSRALPKERSEFISAWSWPLPWLFFGVMLWQIAVYPQSMNDALCYRLPRIFVWLQENSISSPDAPDPRMMEMPWGWELLALPLVALNGVAWVPLINLGAWVVFFVLTHHWASSANAGTWKARWLALAMSSAPFCLLQATSSANDLLAAVLLMVSFHFILRFGKAPDPRRVHLSLLAFMLACGVKPHFLVLGAGWGAWWLFDPAKPWRQTKPIHLALLGSLALVASPLPIFISNYHAAGSFLGSGMKEGLEGGNPLLKMTAASIQFLTAQLQFPVTPGAEHISRVIQDFSPFQSLRHHFPKFQPGVGVVPLIDAASFGSFHFALIIFGIISGWKIADRRFRWLMVFAVAGFLAAGSKVVPTTIGRSFFGFGALLIPPAIMGLAQASNARVAAIAAIAVLAGLLSMVLNPSCPAWPYRMAENLAVRSGKSQLAEKLSRYHDYQKRAIIGVGFLDPVPTGETVATLVRAGTPLVGLWTPDWHRHRIEFVHHLPPGELEPKGYHWLLVGANARETYPSQFEACNGREGWKMVREESYLPTLTGGYERWVLYRRLP